MMNRLTLILFIIVTLSLTVTDDEYIIEFDLPVGTMLDTAQNEEALNSIINKYEKEDSIFIAVSYHSPGEIFQFHSVACVRETQKKLSNILVNTIVCRLDKFDEMSLLRGVFYDKNHKGESHALTLLIRLKNE